ncbi:RidA family protein [Natronorubrum texcoconense]|uniref:2-iminobutanoate/2-iminopropanoate deaminase n=1 Tax=Natronorubrum texcoconense TaxID=1095776 RepID=A0A1G9C139_9EURY|nr:RidA family protein [Natronorubrum texcoconense]SDK45406.1 2-iminobutanoate/2-iminopropanoate deaminase [Natronorubrum texcoconense]
MVRTTNEDERQRNQAPTMNTDDSLSTRSKRQRDGFEHTGAFGQRTGESDLIFFEGIVPKIDGEVLNTHSIEEQTATCFDRLESVLETRNVTLDDVMKVDVHLTDPDASEAVDTVYDSRFDGVEQPPRTVVGVCSLPGGADVQLDVVAADE